MSHYFSRVQLVDFPQDMALLTALSRHGDAYRDHALIWRLFQGDSAPRDFVFRRNQGPRGQHLYYVVSKRAPQSEPGLFTLQSKSYAPRLSAGEWVRFHLRANPTIARRVSPQEPSRRHDVLMHAKRECADRPDQNPAVFIRAAGVAWLAGRAEGWGLKLERDSVSAEGYTQHKLRHKQRSIEFSSLDYEGVARVQDPERLSHALLNGVGHARAFGCGLILVRRIE